MRKWAARHRATSYHRPGSQTFPPSPTPCFGKTRGHPPRSPLCPRSPPLKRTTVLLLIPLLAWLQACARQPAQPGAASTPSLYGVVVTEDGNPVAAARVALYPDAAGAGASATVAGPAGEYAFYDLEPGTYTAVATAPDGRAGTARGIEVGGEPRVSVER